MCNRSLAPRLGCAESLFTAQKVRGRRPERWQISSPWLAVIADWERKAVPEFRAIPCGPDAGEFPPARRLGAGQEGVRLTGPPAAQLCLHHLAGAGNGVAFVVEQPLDAKSHLHIPFAVEPLPGSALIRLELRKLGLPKTQHIRLDRAQAGDVTDAEIKLVRDFRFLRCAPLWETIGHAVNGRRNLAHRPSTKV